MGEWATLHQAGLRRIWRLARAHEPLDTIEPLGQEKACCTEFVDVEVRPDYRVWIRFENGTEGKVDLSELAGKGVFERWSDPAEFERVYVDEDAGTIAWPGGLDLAPDRLYRDVKPVSAPRSCNEG